jgi:hypothetical protein
VAPPEALEELPGRVSSVLRLLDRELGASAAPSQLLGTVSPAAAAAAESGLGPAGSQLDSMGEAAALSALLEFTVLTLKEKVGERGGEGRLMVPSLPAEPRKRPARPPESAAQAEGRLSPAAAERELSSSSQAGRAGL